MKKLIIIYLFLSFNFCFSQNYNWITPNKDYLKVFIAEDGMYRINKIDFLNAGVNTAALDPRTVKVFYKGNQVPIYFSGEGDGIFNDSDYFDFYAQRNYGGITYTYKEFNSSSGSSTVIDYVTDEYYNQYSDTNVYWIGWDGAFGLRYAEYNNPSLVNFLQPFFTDNLHFEKDVVYSLGETVNDATDFRYFNTEKVSGEGWFWKSMERGNFVSDTFSIPALYPVSQNCSLKLFAYPNSYSSDTTNEHKLIIKVNNNVIDTLYRTHYAKFDTTISFSSSLLSATNVNNITIVYTNPGYYAGYLYFDFFKLFYPKMFVFSYNRINFKTGISDTSSKKFKVNGFSSGEVNIYDLKNNFRISNYSVSDDTLIFSGKGNGDYEIVNKYITTKPLRIKKKQVPSLASVSNGADYLLIYNKLFESQAEQLRAYRNSHDNFRSIKADIEDVYDIFNYGIENPVAIRNLVKFAYSNWQTPSLKYLCLMGRGSVDPKKIFSNSVYYKNYIPIYGNPPSDNYYGNVNTNTFVYNTQVSVGRLPVYTTQEAQDAVNKIINYENNPLDSWAKKFTFITGGFNHIEQTQFIASSDNLINSFILNPPVTGYPQRIYRTDTSGQVSYGFEDSIKNTINNGTLLVNYIGHAATSTWDNGIKDPDILTNYSKNPLVLSMTCFTGKNAQTDKDGRGFGEKFVYLPNKGAIGFIGTTGWSFFPGGGNTYNGFLLKSIAVDSVRRIGDVLKGASLYMKNMDTTTFANKNTINSYNLLGDPASKLIMPAFPEFDISAGDYKLSPVFPSLKEQITLTVFPKNLGTRADSCKVRFQLLKNNVITKTIDTVIRNFDFSDTIIYLFKIDSAGIYNAKITLDADDWYKKENETNNVLIIPIPLKNISFVPLKPIDNSVIEQDSVTIVGINPNIDPKKYNIKVYVQLDTTANFNSPLKQTYYKVCDSGVVTKFKIKIPLQDTNAVFFWRTNSVINNTDTSGWTFANRFLYFPIAYTDRKNNISSEDSVISIYKKNASQYLNIDMGNTEFSVDGIKIKNYTGDLLAQAWGGDPENASFFRINSREIFLLDPSLHWGGLNIVKVRKNDGALVEQKHFKFTSPSSSDSVINYLNTFNSNYILMAVKSYVFEGVTDTLRTELRNKFKDFGSLKIDSVNLKDYGRWSFVSYPDGANFITSEAFLVSGSDNAPAISRIQPQFRYDSGYVFHNIGPVAFYKNFNWNKTINPNTSLLFDVYGVDKNNQNIILYSDLSSGPVFIDSLKPYIYPNILLKTKLTVDSLLGYNSPVLKSLKFNYVPPAELISDNYSFVKSDSVMQEGDTVRVSVKYYNVGFIGASTSINTWSASSPSGIRIIKSDTLNSFIPVDGMVQTNVLINTNGLRNPQKPKDTVYIYFDTKLKQDKNEFFTYNNTAITSVILTGDSINPSLDVTYDGIKVMTGDFIQSKPVITAKYLDDSRVQIRDTSNIKVFLDTHYVSYYLGSLKNPDIDIIFPTNKQLQATVIYKPSLADGEHDFMYVAYDAANNYADTVRYILKVNPALKIFDLYTYPNPMKNQTSFIFNLSGSSVPNLSKIKIFSVAGRLVKTINFVPNIGYNRIPWDGRDDDGDYMANGVYLYKLIIDGTSGKETSIEKLVILK
jgi:hypothetical protein